MYYTFIPPSLSPGRVAGGCITTFNLFYSNSLVSSYILAIIKCTPNEGHKAIRPHSHAKVGINISYLHANVLPASKWVRVETYDG